MKTIITFVKVISGVAILVLALIVIMKIIPQPLQVLPPASSYDAYPPPVTATPTRTSTPIPYPPPGTTATPQILISPTRDPMQRPLGWPTGMPWPLPTPLNETKVPMPTKLPVIFPTPAFREAPSGNPPSSFQKLWYLYASDSNSRPVLQMEKIDNSMQRWGKGLVSVNFDLDQNGPGGASLVDLFPSPDGKKVIALINFDVNTTPYLIEADNGKVSQVLPPYMTGQFFAWKPDNQNVAIKGITDPWQSAVVNLTSGEYQLLEFPQYRGAKPTVYALAYSPDGISLADALVYYSLEEKEYLLSIGIWDTKSQQRKTIQEIPSSNSIALNSLSWSADGHLLSWIANKKTNINQSELWISDRTTGETKSIAVFQGNIGNRGRPTWSPDGKKMAVVKYDEKNSSSRTGNIFLIDPMSGAETQVSHFTQRQVLDLHWSLDAQWIFCNVSEKVSGAIWAVNIENGESFPIAGPVIANSPFMILP